MKQTRLRLLLTLWLGLAAVMSVAVSHASTITTFSDGRQPALATSIPLAYPRSVVVDASGSLYLASTSSHTVLKVDGSTKIASVVAGIGVCGFSGDGGPATSAALCYPYGIALDPAGNLVIADSSNGRVRKVAPDGNIITIAGGGACCTLNDGGAAIGTWLDYPTTVAFDADGNLFIADNAAYRIRKVDTSGSISTFAGNGTCCVADTGTGPATGHAVNNAFTVSVDPGGNIWTNANAFGLSQKINAAGNIVSVSQTSGNFGRAFDASGNMIVSLPNCCDHFGASGWSQVLKFDSTGNFVSAVAGVSDAPGYNGEGSPATAYQLSFPYGLVLDPSNNLFIADSTNQRIRKVDSSGEMSTVAGNGNFAQYAMTPFSIAADNSGNIYFADAQGNYVRKLSSDASSATVVAGSGAYGFSGDGIAANASSLAAPNKIALAANGDLYIADSGNHRIRKVSGGVMTTVAGSGTDGYDGEGMATAHSLCNPTGIAVDGAGILYIADSCNHRIRKVDVTTGQMTTLAGNGAAGYVGDGFIATAARLNNPVAVAVDASGNVYVADSTNNRVRRISATGIISTLIGNGVCDVSDDGPASTVRLCSPQDVQVMSGGRIAVTDSFNNRILVMYPSAGVYRVAGNGTFGLSGDGASAPGATLAQPYGAGTDGAGNLFIADTQNHRIRKVTGVPVVEPAKATATIGIGNIPGTATTGASFTPVINYSGNGVTSVTSSTPAICPISGGSVNFIAVGTCTLVAHATETFEYAAANGSPQSFAIGKGTPTISITNLPAAATYGGSFVPTYAYAGDGLPSVTSSTSGVCTVSGNTVNFVGVGTCKLTARATSTPNYAAATGTQQSFAVAKAVTTIAINNLPANAQFGGSFRPTYAYSGNGSKSVTSSSPAICTVSGSTVDFVGTGVCTLSARATASAEFEAATGPVQSFTIAKAVTTITIRNMPSGPKKGSTFTPAYTYAGDGTKSTTSSTPAACTVAGTVVNFVGVGACTLTAHAASSGNYAPADGTPQTVTVKP